MWVLKGPGVHLYTKKLKRTFVIYCQGCVIFKPLKPLGRFRENFE